MFLMGEFHEQNEFLVIMKGAMSIINFEHDSAQYKSHGEKLFFNY